MATKQLLPASGQRLAQRTPALCKFAKAELAPRGSGSQFTAERSRGWVAAVFLDGDRRNAGEIPIAEPVVLIQANKRLLWEDHPAIALA